MHNFRKYPPAIFVHNAESSEKNLEMLQLPLYKYILCCYNGYSQ